ncbi:MAG: BatD family protein [Bacteroidales bacterium]|jgi:hypothetical protein|nr:BatD family protein [Bacteroidales bacterium]
MKVSKFNIVWLIVLCTVTAVHGQQLSVRVRPDTTRLLIADLFHLTIELEHDRGLAVSFPATGDTLTATLEVRNRSSIDTLQLDNGRIRLSQTLTIQPFDTGYVTVPPFRFHVAADGQNTDVESDSLQIYVHSFPVDMEKGPVDIKPLYEAPLSLREVAPWLLGAIVVGGLIFFLFYYISRRKQNKPLFAFAEKPVIPPHIIALRELDRIKEQKIWQQNLIKAYYSDITDVLRLYIQSRFGITAMEFTTEEILAALKKKKDVIPAKSLTTLHELLGLADLVKFAKYEPQADDHNVTLMNAYFFVNDTKPDEPQTSLSESVEETKDGIEVNY